MKVLVGTGGDVKVHLAFEETEKIDGLEIFEYLKEKELFKGSTGETYSNLAADGKHEVVVGLGKEEELEYEDLKLAFFNLGKELMKLKAESAEVTISEIEDLKLARMVLSITEGLLQSEYAFEKYLSEKKTKPSVEEFFLNIEGNYDEKEINSAIKEGNIIIEGIFLARDLVNEPAIVMTPSKLAEKAKEELEPVGVEVEVLGESEIKELKMDAFLSVAKGSEEEPKFIVMKWLKGGDADTIGLVGKGLTYDTGGYSLKPSNSMDTMFTDMAGSASVIGTMKAVAKANLERNVVAVVAACENAISGGAYKPGDIISSMSGKTIEVANTDAEGRLTLADALWYTATELKADKIVDVATLTGACVVALSDVASGAVTNDQDWMDEVKEASKFAGEHLWQLPHYKEFHERIKSKRADLINTSTGPMGAGTITAGLFLGEFVDGKPWVHLDIAGTSYIKSGRGYLPAGATGIPVNTLYNLVKSYN